MSSAGNRFRKAMKRKRSGGKPTSSRKLFTSPYKRPRLQQMSRMVVPVGRGPVPQQTIVTLKYNSQLAVNGLDLDSTFNLNSIFEPYAGVSTHQPLGRDQYATFYNRYRVKKVKATVVSGTVSTYSGGPLQLILVADNSSTALTSVPTSIEQRGATQHVSVASNNGPIKAVRTFYPHKITGVTAKAYEDDRFQALMTATPVERIMLHVCTADMFGNLPASGAVQLSITLEYTVALFDPNPLAGS